MIRRPVVGGRHVAVTGDPADQYFAGLSDDRDWADNVLDLLLRLVRPDDVVIEVGANIGLHTLALSSATPAGRIYAFEPAHRTVGYLRDNVDANDARNVTVIQSAVSADAGTLELYANREFAAGSLIVEQASPVLRAHLDTADSADGPQPLDPATTPWGDFENVTAITLDDFAKEMNRLDIIKIDTEGHDMQVLRGAGHTLTRFRPTVLMEFSSFALTLHDSTLPAEALTTIRTTFDHVVVIEPDGRHWPIVSDTDAWKFLHANATLRPVHDLLCLFDGSPALSRLNTRGDTASPDCDLGSELDGGVPQVNDSPDHEAQESATREDLDAANASVEQLRAELAAMRRTFSWRLTGPLRKVRSVFR
jgi:FkbM family methyltransferase